MHTKDAAEADAPPRTYVDNIYTNKNATVRDRVHVYFSCRVNKC